jgi:hypothetical protein
MNGDMSSMDPLFPAWVTPVSWFFVGLGVISAAVVLLQIITRGRHQRKQDLAMNVVWPVAALFLGPVAIWAYDRWGTTNPGRPNSGPSDDQEAAQTIAGSAPGGAAATVGHFIGVPLVVASGLTIAGTNLWVLIIVIAALAIGLLFVFEYAVGSSASGGARKRNIGVMLITATLTVLAFDIGMGGWMLFMHFGNFMPSPTDVRFFFLMQVGLVLGLVTAYPMVKALLRRRAAATS